MWNVHGIITNHSEQVYHVRFHKTFSKTKTNDKGAKTKTIHHSK